MKRALCGFGVILILASAVACADTAATADAANEIKDSADQGSGDSESLRPGVIERKVTVDKKGNKVLVLKGTYIQDGSFQAQQAEERRIQEERRLEQEREAAMMDRMAEMAALLAATAPRNSQETNVQANPIQTNGVIINNENQNVATAMPIIGNPYHGHGHGHGHYVRPCPPRVVHNLNPQPSRQDRTEAWLRNPGSYF